ncbi:MAG: hypothetical protein KGO96_06930 [Elusimicrobia bacterium]|nr:hypothetical protein [Elusimicrobiota bacterium]
MFPDLKSIALSNFPVIKGNGTNLDEAVRLAFIDFATRLKTEKNINIIEFLEDKIVAL